MHLTPELYEWCHFQDVSNDDQFNTVEITELKSTACGPGSSVGPGIESQCGRDFPHLSRPALGPTHPPVQWVPGLSRGRKRPGRDADPSPLLVPRSKKRVELSLRVFEACKK
jgi:hypothetical protein